MNFFLHFIYRYETSQYKKAGDNLKKKDIKTQLNQLPNIHISRRNPTSRWVDSKQPINWVGALKIYTCVSISFEQ
jgi:hypothetical protein